MYKKEKLQNKLEEVLIKEHTKHLPSQPYFIAILIEDCIKKNQEFQMSTYPSQCQSVHLRRYRFLAS